MNRNIRGFSLIELMISMAIFLFMTTVMLYEYPDSVMRINLANLTHKFALLIREAQVRGSAIDSKNSAVSGYGVYVTSSNKSQIIFFSDFPNGTLVNGILIGDSVYSTNPVDEMASVLNLPNGYSIAKLCLGNGWPFTCDNSLSPNLTSLTISFQRPNPQALIYANNTTLSTLGGACFELRSPKAPNIGHIRSVQIYNSGRIITSSVGCN